MALARLHRRGWAPRKAAAAWESWICGGIEVQIITALITNLLSSQSCQLQFHFNPILWFTFSIIQSAAGSRACLLVCCKEHRGISVQCSQKHTRGEHLPPAWEWVPPLQGSTTLMCELMLSLRQVKNKQTKQSKKPQQNQRNPLLEKSILHLPESKRGTVVSWWFQDMFLIKARNSEWEFCRCSGGKLRIFLIALRGWESQGQGLWNPGSLRLEAHFESSEPLLTAGVKAGPVEEAVAGPILKMWVSGDSHLLSWSLFCHWEATLWPL